MQKSNLKVVAADAGQARTPERERLAETIARHNELTRRLAAIDAALEMTRRQRWAAQEVVNRSPKLIEEAKAAAANFLTEQVLGSTGAPPLSVKEARAKAQLAQDELDVAEAASGGLAGQRKEVENSLVVVRLNLNSRIDAVIGAEIPIAQMIEDFRRDRRDLAARYAVLEWLDKRGAIPRDIFWRADREVPNSGVAKMEACRAALAANADAPLPT